MKHTKQARSIVNWLWLSHHRNRFLHRTWKLPWGQRRLAVCCRCTGVWLGVAIGLAVFLLLRPRWPVTIAAVLLLPMPGLIDWLNQSVRNRESTTFRRLFTGFLAGLAVGTAFGTAFTARWLEIGAALLAYLAYSVTLACLTRATGCWERLCKEFAPDEVARTQNAEGKNDVLEPNDRMGARWS